MSSGLGGLNKSPHGVVIGLVQLALPDPRNRQALGQQTQRVPLPPGPVQDATPFLHSQKVD